MKSLNEGVATYIAAYRRRQERMIIHGGVAVPLQSIHLGAESVERRAAAARVVTVCLSVSRI